MAVKVYNVEEAYLRTGCALGEGPHENQDGKSLRFVDIVRNEIHSVDTSVGPASHRIVAKLDFSIGVTCDISGSEDVIAFAGKSGYGILDLRSAKTKYIKDMWTEDEKAGGKESRMRMNDGNCDTLGRFWASAVRDPLKAEFAPEGVLFRLDSDLSLHRMLEKTTIGNGISWTKDEKTMYFTDTAEGAIFAFDFDNESGSISNKRTFFDSFEEDTGPDGHAMDEEEHLWVAIFGGGKVIRISPRGEIVAEIKLPTQCITCPAFIGEDLYITSAREVNPDKFPDSVKEEGNVFRCHVGVRGRKVHKFCYTGDMSFS